MTSDAKIGLLVGLVFIFIIAFIINGLPRSFNHQTDNNELTGAYLDELRDDSLGLTDKVRQAAKAISHTEPVNQPQKNATGPDKSEEVRFVTKLPTASPITPAAHPAPTETKIANIQPKMLPRPATPQIYVVQEDDNLAVIAKKFYGPEEGNRKVNIDRIFLANQKVLKSPDRVYIGQKIIIPDLSTSRQNIAKSGLFEKVRRIGKKARAVQGSLRKQSKNNAEYVVREGDCLWQIAARHLGNGDRFDEIIELNHNIITDEEYLFAGMRLKLPR